MSVELGPRSISGGLIGQAAASTLARLAAAGLQVVCFVLLARGLGPHGFAGVSMVYAVLNIVVALNGFGLLRQLLYRRSLDPSDPSLGELFDHRLRFSHLSAWGWVVTTVGLWLLTGDGFCLAVAPAAVWLLFEQTTQVWNGLSLVDGRAWDLMTSLTLRRLPVVCSVAAALVTGHDLLWSWSLGLATGGVLAWFAGRRRQEHWARSLLPARRRGGPRFALDLGYWLGLLGTQLRDLDVAAVAAASASASALYAFPARLVGPMNLITTAIGQVVFPRVARRGHLGRRDVVLVLGAGLAPVTAVAGVVYAGAGSLPVLLGSAYAGSAPLLRVMCLTAVANGALMLLSLLLQAWSDDASRSAGFLNLGGGVLHLLAAAAGAVVAGGLGAAVATAMTTACLACVAFGLVDRRARGGSPPTQRSLGPASVSPEPVGAST